MLFYLTTLHVANVLTAEDPLALPEGEGENVPTEEAKAERLKAIQTWESQEFLCRNYILNALDDSLYDIYSTFRMARELWQSLENKYKTEVACSKKFVIGKFLNFKMSDATPVVKQVEELQVIVHELEVEGMGLNPDFLAGAIIEKLPHSWKNFKGFLKHLTEEMNFEQLILKIRIKEDNRKNEKADAGFIGVVIAQANLVTNSTNWWMDTGATRHVCSEKDMVSSYQAIKDGEPLFVENGAAVKVEGKGKVTLRLTSVNDLVLTNVLHVPEICKKLIFGPVFSNKGFKLVFESDKFVLTKGGVYVGKGYGALQTKCCKY